MSATVESVEALVTQLAEALYASDVNLPMDDPLDISCRDVARALAPFVAALPDPQATAAEALREAARELPGFDSIRTHGDAARWLRDRADRLVQGQPTQATQDRAAVRFRVEVACDGYEGLTEADVPEPWTPENYIAGAAEAARQIRAALAGPHHDTGQPTQGGAS